MCSLHVSKHAATCLQACSHMPPSLDPHTSKPAARCAPACSPLLPSLQLCTWACNPTCQVAWNEVALTQGNLITGYPHGPTNLPMYGKLLREHNCGKLCRHQWLNATRGMYWCGSCSVAPSAPVPHAHTPRAKTQAFGPVRRFGHKLPSSWHKYADNRYCGCRFACGPLGISSLRETTDVPFDAPWPVWLSIAARLGYSP